MMTLKRRILLFNILTFFTTMVIVVGLTACSGKAINTTDLDSSKPDTVENGQDYAKETQEVQGSNTPTAYTSMFDTEEAQVVSGKCGKDAVWTYDADSELLQITGTGVVDQRIKKSEEYVSEYGLKKRYRVKEIRVGEGITALDGGPLFLNVRKAKGAEEIKLSLPDSLEKIGADTFDPGQNDAIYIRHIHLPNKVRYIEGGAFWGLGDEAELQNSFREDVKSISQKYKEKLKITIDSKNPYYTIKDGVLFTKDIKTLVYYPSEKTDKVYRIPKSVIRIKPLAFARNSFLKEVILPDGLKEIGAGAFFNNHRLAKINLEQAKKLKRIQDFDGVKYKISLGCWTGAPVGVGMEVLEESDERYHVLAEYRKDFYGSTKVRKEYYFLGTFAGTNLKSIQFPERLKYAAYNTFKNCLRLKKISFGESYAGEVNPDRLCDKKGFSLPMWSAMEIQVSESNKHYKVRNHILYSKDGRTVYKALKSYQDATLVLDKNVQKIAREAFSGNIAKKLRKVVVLGSLKQISREAFALRGIKSFEVYGNVDTIDVEAFYCCWELQKFICHGTVKNIGAQAFYYATNLRNLSLGKNIASLGAGAFDGCGGIKKPHVMKN